MRGARLASSCRHTAASKARSRGCKLSLDRFEAEQNTTLNTLEENYDAKARRMRNILADLGLDLGKIAPPLPARATGGPFVPVERSGVSTFDRQLYRIRLVRGQVERLTRTLTAVPIRKPMIGELDSTSGFGMRTDPFIRAPAMHTGLDFRADTGEPARATAAGTVTMAGWNGGYGKMVEVDHGNGFATRYAHLSAIDVEVGQTIRIGQIVGKVGIDRPLDRPASALRNARRRRSGRSAEIPARGRAARRRALTRRAPTPRPRPSPGPVPNAFWASVASMN